VQQLVVGAALAAFCCALPAHAADGDPPPPDQQGGATTTSSPSGTQGEEVAPDSADTSVASTTAINKNLADQANGKLTKNVLLLRDQSTRAKSWGLLLTMSTFAGSGEFQSGAAHGYSKYVAQIYDFRPTYGFNLRTHRIRVQGRFAFEQDWTPPPGFTNPARRWRPYDTSVTVADDTLYHWNLTGILLNTALRVTLPTSYESINVRKQYLALGLTFGARRLVGPVQLAFTSTTTKYFNGSPVAVGTRLARTEDGVENVARDMPQDINAGYANNNWLFANTLSATFLASDNFAVSAAFGVLAFIKYSVHGSRDQYTSPYADPGYGTAQRFTSNIEVNYDLTYITKGKLGLPFRLTTALGVQATTPVQTTDNRGWIAPLILNAFTNRAADNYGSIYLDVTAIF
jgi:hypothetical protein